MTAISHGANMAIAQKFPWQNYRSAVDAGTAQGDLIVQVARAHAHLAGIGFDRIQDVFAATFPPAGGQGNAQSTYLQIAAEGGALGILGLIAVLLALPRDLARVLARERLWGAVLCGA